MARSLAQILAETIFARTLDVITRPDIPIQNSYAERVASEITKEVAPVLQNATNSEPWYRSRIYIGLIAAGLGAIAQHFGVQISGADIELVTNSVPEVMQAAGTLAEAAGLLYALYGRFVGAFKKPLGR